MLPTSLLARSARNRHVEDSLNGAAYSKIKEQIIALKLPPAALIDEHQLAHELQIGLTPVRQALRRLAMENLVVILPRRGTMVADLNLSDLQKIFELRLELEGLAAQLAAQRATIAEVDELEQLLINTDGLIQAGDNHKLLELDRAVHGQIARCAHNEFLEQTLDWLYCHVLRLWNLALQRIGVLGEAMRDHQQIVAAIRAGESQRAAELMHAHVQHFQEAFKQTF